MQSAPLPQSETAPREDIRENELARTLGPFSLVFSGLGIILGAGIYSVIGVAAGEAGASLWLAFLASGVVAFFTALSYAELTTAYPRASAEFTYLRESFPRAPSLAVTVGVLVAFSGIATSSAVSIAFGGYLERFVSMPPLLTALLLLLTVTGINVIGAKQTTSVTVLFTLVEMGGLVAVIVVGAGSPRFAEALTATPSAGLAQATALVFFAFLGFENIANLAEEAKKPSRDLPRAIFGSLLLATALYTLVALAVVALVPPERLASSHEPLVTAVMQRSPRIAGALGGVALFATANTALASILVASRVLFGMARERSLPAPLAKVLPKRKTPWVATLVTGACALLLLPLGEVDVVASVSSFAALLSFFAVNVCLVTLRKRDADRARPFRVPLSIRAVPVLPIVGAVLTLALITRLDPIALAVGTGAGLSVLVCDVLVRRRRARSS